MVEFYFFQMANLPRPIHVFGDFKEKFHVIAIDFYKSNNDEDIVICGYQIGLISTWSLSTYRCLRRINLDDYIKDKNIELLRLRSMIYIHCRQILVAELASGNLCLFKCDFDDLENFHLINHWPTLKLTFAKMIFILENRFLTYLDPDNSKQINLIDLDQPTTEPAIKIITEENDHGIVMASHLFFNTNRFLYNFITYEDGFLLINKSYLDSNKPIIYSQSLSSVQLHQGEILHMDYNNCIERGIACCAPNKIVIWKCSKNRKIDLFKTKRFSINSESITCCTIRPDGEIFAIGSKDGRIRLFTTSHGRPLAVITYHHESIETLRFTSNLSMDNYQTKYLLFASTQDGLISIWSLYNNNDVSD